MNDRMDYWGRRWYDLGAFMSLSDATPNPFGRDRTSRPPQQSSPLDVQRRRKAHKAQKLARKAQRA